MSINDNEIKTPKLGILMGSRVIVGTVEFIEVKRGKKRELVPIDEMKKMFTKSA